MPQNFMSEFSNKPEEADCDVEREDSYDLDEQDAQWLKKLSDEKKAFISYSDFEHAIEALENNSRKSIISFTVFCLKFNHLDRAALDLIYDYWLSKRLTLCRSTFQTASLIPLVPNTDFEADNVEYVAFRERCPSSKRRSSRLVANQRLQAMSTRKREKTDEEKRIETAEYWNTISYKSTVNSELDGNFEFKRNRYCSYRDPICF